MLSAIVVATHSSTPTSAARTLAALVPTLVQGLMRDVQLLAPSNPAFADLADQSGCVLVTGGAAALAQAIRAARQEWLFVLQAGFAPESGFLEEAEDFIAAGIAQAGLLRRKPDGLLTRIWPKSAAVAGIIAPRHMLAACAGLEPAHLARRAKPGKTLMTQARAVT